MCEFTNNNHETTFFFSKSYDVHTIKISSAPHSSANEEQTVDLLDRTSRARSCLVPTTVIGKRLSTNCSGSYSNLNHIIAWTNSLVTSFKRDEIPYPLAAFPLQFPSLLRISANHFLKFCSDFLLVKSWTRITPTSCKMIIQ